MKSKTQKKNQINRKKTKDYRGKKVGSRIYESLNLRYLSGAGKNQKRGWGRHECIRCTCDVGRKRVSLLVCCLFSLKCNQSHIDVTVYLKHRAEGAVVRS